jgi:hypothetical protein
MFFNLAEMVQDQPSFSILGKKPEDWAKSAPKILGFRLSITT